MENRLPVRRRGQSAAIRGLCSVFAALLLTAGCDGPQSALNTAGEGSQIIAQLFYWMLGGACVIWGVVILLAILGIRSKSPHDLRRMRAWLIGGGTACTTVILTALLAYGLSLMPKLQQPTSQERLTVHVAGVRWWWRIRYPIPPTESVQAGVASTPAGETSGNSTLQAAREDHLELANEIVLPVGQVTEFRLSSEDVVHSFWIPALGGKVDMIPGRETRLLIKPIRTGVFRGVCAEYCGTAHAQMAFSVRVLGKQEFNQWWQRQQQAANVASDHPGRRLFRMRGCSACHAVRGTEADGKVGPDLTHFASRATIGAGLMENDEDNLKDWLTDLKHLKPGVEMPEFPLSESEVDELADYLERLR